MGPEGRQLTWLAHVTAVIFGQVLILSAHGVWLRVDLKTELGSLRGPEISTAASMAGRWK